MRIGTSPTSTLSALAVAAIVGGGVLAHLPAPAPAWAWQESAGAAKRDVIILRNGTVIEGEILDETPTHVRVRVMVGGIAGVTEYARREVVHIERRRPADPPSPTGDKTPPVSPPALAADRPAPASPPARAPIGDRKKVYLLELSGWFGQDISQTPIRKAVADAKSLGVDYIIVKVNNDWSLKRFRSLTELKDDTELEQEYLRQLFRAEDMAPIFTEEIPRWDKPPKVVFWVRNAMGGATFLPFLCPDIYFHSEGKMGGIWRIERMFGSAGHKMVREKMFSAGLGHAESKALLGGYDPRIVRAMARTEYVLSVRFEGGKPVLLERMPEGPDEILLTDDGEGSNEDSIEALARGEGNDCLTLTADLAFKLNVSKGTADTLESLLFHLGIARNADVISDRGEKIMQAWRDGIDDAKRTLPRLWREFQGVQPRPPGGYRERTEARGRQRRLIEEMQRIIKRFEEALNPQEVGVPPWDVLEARKKQIELEQLGDKPDRR